MRAVVVGGSGQIGGWLLRLLGEGGSRHGFVANVAMDASEHHSEPQLASPENADPAKLKEFVERDALWARRKLEATLADHPNSVNLWEAYVWTFVLTSDAQHADEPSCLHPG